MTQDRILEQTTKTNGRVSSLETWREVHSESMKADHDKIEEVRDSLKWVTRLILATLISTVLVGMLGLIFK